MISRLILDDFAANLIILKSHDINSGENVKILAANSLTDFSGEIKRIYT